jgi:hypothetical protein
MELLITLAVIALVAFALDHTRTRHPTPHPNPHLAGSTDIIDRDTERITADLRTHP